jgi:hypothetical protein
MKPMAAAVAGALISGVAMYTVGARTQTVDAFTQAPALVQTVDDQYVPAAQGVSYTSAQPATAAVRPVALRRTSARNASGRRTAAQPAVVYRDDDRITDRTADRVVERQPQRTWKKSALIIGGSTASAAGVGAIVDGKKGALIGAAIGGGAASIYEATRRR